MTFLPSADRISLVELNVNYLTDVDTINHTIS